MPLDPEEMLSSQGQTKDLRDGRTDSKGKSKRIRPVVPAIPRAPGTKQMGNSEDDAADDITVLAESHRAFSERREGQDGDDVPRKLPATFFQGKTALHAVGRPLYADILLPL